MLDGNLEVARNSEGREMDLRQQEHLLIDAPCLLTPAVVVSRSKFDEARRATLRLT